MWHFFQNRNQTFKCTFLIFYNWESGNFKKEYNEIAVNCHHYLSCWAVHARCYLQKGMTFHFNIGDFGFLKNGLSHFYQWSAWQLFFVSVQPRNSSGQLFIFRLRSSQNVALIQYRIPRNSQGFIFRVSYATNDDRKYYLYTMTLLK